MSEHIDDHLYGHMSVSDDDDAPDGAWWAMLEEAVVRYNEQHNKHYDPFETVHAYIRQKESEQ